MTFLELAKMRYSVRSFKNTPVEEEKLNLILEAGRVAPTAATISPRRSMLPRARSPEKNWLPSAAVPLMRL